MNALHITADTTVAAAIARDPGLVDRLAAFRPAFAKLKNPVLRKTMAKLITFGDAARVAGVTLDDLLAVANCATSVGTAAMPENTTSPAQEPRPGWADDIDLDGCARLDVRTMIDAGQDPLATIMPLAATVADGAALVIDAPFDPAPLRRVLGRKGFSSYGESLNDEHWRIWFRRDGGEQFPAGAVKDEAVDWMVGPIAHIDVRGLDAPMPMIAVIALLERPGTGGEVIVHHEREPLYLYPELAERGWSYEVLFTDGDEVRLRLTKD